MRIKNNISGDDRSNSVHDKSGAPPAFGDKRAVAAMLGMSVRSVDNLMGQGMPYMRLGTRRVRFDLEEVRTWLKGHFGTRRRDLAGS